MSSMPLRRLIGPVLACSLIALACGGQAAVQGTATSASLEEGPPADIFGYVFLLRGTDTLVAAGADVWTEMGHTAVTDSAGSFLIQGAIPPGTIDISGSFQDGDTLRQGSATVEVRLGTTSEAYIILGEDRRGDVSTIFLERLGEVLRRGPGRVRSSGGQ